MCFTYNERQSLGKNRKRIGELYLFWFGVFCAALTNCMTFFCSNNSFLCFFILLLLVLLFY